MSRHSSRVTLLLASTALAALTSPAMAQDAIPQVDAAENDSPEIVVTGTRIEGAKTTAALPVVVLGEDRLDAIGSASGDDLFRSIPQAGDVQFQESRTTGNLNDARGDNASINLRNLGTGNTLVLLNGRRMILTPGTQTENFVPVQTANTNSLPVGSVRRIEVLLDGAAAIYGSDAVAGVVNVVTDSKFTGLRATGRYGWADGFSETTVGAKAGFKTSSGGRFTLSGTYFRRTPLFTSERPYSVSENHLDALIGTPWEGDTAFDNRTTSGPYGGFVALNANGTTATVRQGTTTLVTLTSSGAFHVQPSVYTPATCGSTVYGGGVCLRSGAVTGATDRPLRYDENPDRTIRGALDRYNAFAAFEQPLGSVELFGEANYYHATLDGQREQSAPISSAVITIPKTNYWNPFGATTIGGVANPNRLPNLTGVPVDGLNIRIANYRPVDTGPRTFTVTDDMYRGVLGLRGNLGAWKWEGAVTYAEAKTNDTTHNAVSATLFQRQLALSTPDAYNPFNGGSDPAYSLGDSRPSSAASIAPFLVDVSRKGKTSLLTGDFRINTSKLFTLPGGDVGVAAGIEWRRETFADNRDDRLDGTIKYTDSVTGIVYGTDVIGASGAPDVKADRSVFAAYAELAIPLVSPEMGVPLISALDLQVAGRYEHYSDFGDVAKPKIAALWKLLDGMKFRGSWSQSFRAPNLPQFYSDGSTVSNNRTDYALCRATNINATCSAVATLEVRAGNDQLKPENSTNLTAGVVFEPRRWLTLSFDWWRIKSKGVIGIEGAQNQILYDQLLRQSGSSNPNVVRLAPVAPATIGAIDYVQDNYFNLGPRTIEGWDAHVELRSRETGFGRFELSGDLAKLTKLFQSPSALQQQIIDANSSGLLGPSISVTRAGDLVRQGGNPQWHWSIDARWRYGGFTLSALVNSVGSIFETGTRLVNSQLYRVPSWTTVSGYAQYRFDDDGPIGGTRLRFGVRNLFDKDPPLTSSNYGFNGALHNPSGRLFYVDLSKDF